MSGSDSEITINEKPKKMKKFTALKIAELEKFEPSALCEYIEKLHEVLKTKEKTVKKCKEKIKKLLLQIQELTAAQASEVDPKKIDALKTATDNAETQKAQEPDGKTTAISFVDEIRQAAEQAQNLNGFVYEPTSGLYYDQKTGYYYNAEYGLYYDGNSGCYYNYNQEKNVFEFHSQVEVQPNQNAKKSGGTNDDGRYDSYDKSDNESVGLAAEEEAEVQFDEQGGVITDKEMLRKLRKDKRKRERESERKKRKQKKKQQKKSLQSKKSKKKSKSKSSRKRSKRERRNSSSAEDSDGNEAGSEKKQRTIDMEDGELSDSSTDSSSNSSSNNISSSNDNSSNNDAEYSNDVPIFKSGGRFQDIAKKYPPSLRIIVQDTNLESLKVGSLSLITYKGGSLGREGDHDVIIPDVNVSKCHLEFSYDRKKSVYLCVDLGSQNGTLLNGVRMSLAKATSEPQQLVHGSVLQIGQTKLLCHTHEGNSTCGLCEPGLLIEQQTERELASATATVHLSHKEQLKRLQKKYGLENEKFVDGKQLTTTVSYKDRAATRRVNVGSSSDKEKTQTASVSTAISSENKGFKMLSKLGWNKGEALGKSQAATGLLEPINVATNEGKKGLGCETPSMPSLSSLDKKKLEAVRKMQERYQKTTDIFTLSDDSDS